MTLAKVLTAINVAIFVVLVIFVSDERKKNNEECFDAGGLIVKTEHGWLCVKEAQ
jgi:hypothetical protein